MVIHQETKPVMALMLWSPLMASLPVYAAQEEKYDGFD